MKKSLSFVLILALIVSFVPPALADEVADDSQEGQSINVSLSYAGNNSSTSLKVSDTVNLLMNDNDGIITSWSITDRSGEIMASKSYSMWLGSQVTSTTVLGSWSPSEAGTYTVKYTISGYSKTLMQVNGSYQYVYQPNGVATTYQQTFIVTERQIPFTTILKSNGAIHWAVGSDCFTGSGRIITASYGPKGQLLQSTITSVANLSSGTEGEVLLATQAGGWYKVFLLDAEFAPLTNASIQYLEPSENITSSGQAVFELLRAYAMDNGVLSNGNYRAAVSYQNREGEIWYFTEGDYVGVFYTGNDSENLSIPVLSILNTGEVGSELVFSQTGISSRTTTQAIFAVDPANFSGENAPALTEYVSTGLAGLEDLKFKEDCRHSFTQLLILLNDFLGEKNYSVADLGFSSFAPGKYPSQNAAFNELVAYAMSGGKNTDGSYITKQEISNATYYVKYDSQNRSIILGASMSGVTCDTRLTIYADMRQPYKVEMDFFPYSGTATAAITPSTFKRSSGIALDSPNSSNTNWANECMDWIDIILKNTQTYPLFTSRNFTLGYELKDLGFLAYQIQ
jgi:hypothetical protein